MKYIILFALFSCLSFSLIGQASKIKNRNPFQYVKNHDNFGEYESTKMPNFDSQPFFITTQKDASPNYQLKNADVLKQRLDSILYFEGNTIIQKLIFIYDNNGSITEEIIYEYTDKLIPTELFQFSYDNQLHLTTQIKWEWDLISLSWLKNWKKEYTYDKNILVNHFFSRWMDSKQNWDIYYYYEYKYNDEVKLTRSNFYTRSDNSTSEISELFNSSFTVYNYDTKRNNLISEAYYDIVGTLYDSTMYSYDSNDQLIEENTYSYYNSLTEEYKNKYEYDENKRMILKIKSRKRNGTDFENRYKSEWTYNSYGDLEKYTFYLGNSDVNQWFADINLAFTYNTAFLEKDLIFPFCITDGYVEDGLAERVFNHQIINESINGINAVYYYSPFDVTGIFQDQNMSFSAYPNPASDSVTFNWTNGDKTLNLGLFQISGTLVLEQTVSNGKSVSIKQFQKGIYTYKLYDGKKILYTGKLVLY